MRKHLGKALLLFIVAAFCAFLLVWWTVPRQRINRESLQRIVNGMTENEVVAVFGAPSGDYCTAPEGTVLTCFIPDGLGLSPPLIPVQGTKSQLRQIFAESKREFSKDMAREQQEWLSDDCMLIIYFKERRVVATEIADFAKKPTFYEMIRDLIGR